MDRRLFEHVVYRTNLTRNDRRSLPELGDLGVAALVIGADAGVIVDWYRALGREPRTRFETVAALAVDDEAMGAAIDARLDEGSSAELTSDLSRAGLLWAHPRFESQLDEDDARFAAANLLVDSDPEVLLDWLEGAEVVEEVYEVLRAAALAGAADFFDLAMDWRGRVAEASPDDVTRFDAVLATVDPSRYARELFAGNVGADWTADSRSVADFLQVHGLVSWVETAGLLDELAQPGFAFAAALAVVASAGAAHPVDDELATTLEEALLDDDAWEALANQPEFGFATALGDEELQQLFVEIAAHERLIQHGFESPGVPGLPISTTALDDDYIDAARAFLTPVITWTEPTDDQVVAAVRTLCDVADWRALEPERLEALSEVVVPLTRHANPAIARAAAIAAAQVDDDVAHLAVAADSEGLAGIYAVERLVAIGDEDAARALAGLWLDGPLARVDLYRGALMEVFELLVEESAEGAGDTESDED